MSDSGYSFNDRPYINLGRHGPAYTRVPMNDWDVTGDPIKLQSAMVVSGLLLLIAGGIVVYLIGLMVFVWGELVLPHTDVPIGKAIFRSIEICLIPASLAAALTIVAVWIRRRFTAR